MRELFQKSSLAIIGLGKNTGKTSFLNELLEEARIFQPDKVLAITSIGRDGEEKDLVTSTKKPRIYVYEGTLVATSTDLLPRCDVTMEILQVFPVYSALGRIVLLRALSDGFVEIAGPSRKKDLEILEKGIRLFERDALFIVDGALSRMSFSTCTESTVLCTGVNISRNLSTVYEKTVDALHFLQLPETERALPQEKGRAFVLEETWEAVEGHLALSLGKEIQEMLTGSTKAVYIRGALTDSLLEQLLQQETFREMELIAEDSTRYLVGHEILRKLQRRGIRMRVGNALSVSLLLVNPYDTSGLENDTGWLMEKLSAETNLPVLSLKELQRRRGH